MIKLKSFYGKTGSKTYIFQLKNGDYLLEGINELIAKEGIKNGVLVSGLGTLDSCAMHVVATTGFPARDELVTWTDKPIGISAMSGIIADGVPHIHIVISDYSGDQKAYTGHLEPGSRVLYLVEIVIIEIDDIEMERITDEKGIKELGLKD